MTETLAEGELSFSVESRILREVGERLVKEPEVALLELIKNAYDADARTCDVTIELPDSISVRDDGHGMTLAAFQAAWMRIGTSSKAGRRTSPNFQRQITGEKGIGRFAVRFLGRVLELRSVADDESRSARTVLSVRFNWPQFDRTEDLGQLKVPYRLTRARPNEPTGTLLRISRLREQAQGVDLRKVRTGSISILSPLASLLGLADAPAKARKKGTVKVDPGFLLRLVPAPDGIDNEDVAKAILDSAVLRARVELRNDRLRVKVYRRAERSPALAINDRYPNLLGGTVSADIRFFPQRKGTFSETPVDGRVAKGWVKDNSGVAVFDRMFRVLPYGSRNDDWLGLAADTARRSRNPRSKLAKKHFPMDEETRKSTQLNYMLRLPYPEQLVGVVRVATQRSDDLTKTGEGLIPAADREGFIDNAAFRQLWDIVRGAVEAIAAADRELQLELEAAERASALRALRAEAKRAIREIEKNPRIRPEEKKRLVQFFASTSSEAERYEQASREASRRLEVMSLLGVVAGFMTHEFGAAVHDLETAHGQLVRIAKREPGFGEVAEAIALRINKLKSFSEYTMGYIAGATVAPKDSYPARPRVNQAIRVWGSYATERGIDIQVDIEPRLLAPLVPVSLYNGVVLNLLTNSLKAVAASPAKSARVISFRAWNEPRRHVLEVCDSGVGIPAALKTRVFEPLFTTTGDNKDPLGSGMGLGLPLVRRALEAYGGRIELVNPPANFSTCFKVTLPLES